MNGSGRSRLVLAVNWISSVGVRCAGQTFEKHFSRTIANCFIGTFLAQELIFFIRIAD